MESSKLIADLFRAYYDSRKNKRNTINALKFEIEYEKNLFQLCRDIENREYEISPSVCFIVNSPLKREIFAADFRDRIVHHLIFNYINPLFEKHFIKDSYSCRIGKGTSYGIKRVDHFLRSCSENYQKDCWILKLDIQGYFMAMDRNILYAKIKNRLEFVKTRNVETPHDDVETPRRGVSTVGFDIDLILYLIHTVIFNDPTKNCHIKGKREDWVGLPKSKSLFFAKENKGFPIGNLTSQLFGNIYLDEFDHLMKEKLNIKHYGRYVDDMVFIHPDKEFLKTVTAIVETYCNTSLHLTIHPKKIYLQHFKKGVQFLGTFIKPWRIYAGKRTKGNFYAKIQEWNEVIAKRNLNKKEIQEFVSCMNSYLGIMQHYDTYKLRKKMLDENLAEKFWGYVGSGEGYGKLVYLGSY